MAFESLTDRLAGVFKKLRGHGKKRFVQGKQTSLTGGQGRFGCR